MLFTYRKLWLYIIIISLLTSTIEAQRAKSLDEHFTDVEKSAKNLGYQLDNVKNYMDEIHKSDPFLDKTFLGVKPRWYMSGRIYNKFTTEYPYKVKKTVFKKKIRNLFFKNIIYYDRWSGRKSTAISLHMHSLKFLIKDSSFYQKYTKDIREVLTNNMLSNSNIEKALNDLKKYEDEIRFLVKKNIYMKFKKLSDNAHLIDNDFMKEQRIEKEPFNIYNYDDKIIENNPNVFRLKLRPNDYIKLLEKQILQYGDGWLRIEIKFNIHKFSIISNSKSELYSQESDFFSMLDEYKKDGFCTKTISDEYVLYKSLNSNKYKGYIQYNKEKHEGFWATSIGNSSDDLFKITDAVEDEYREFLKISKEYHALALKKIIKKYLNKSENNNIRLGNEF